MTGVDHAARPAVDHHGGCHCGAVRFRVRAPARFDVSQCNCSVCSKSGYLGLIVPRSRFTLLCAEDWLRTYTFNTGVARHLFCGSCGVKSFYYPRSHRDAVNVNARCLDPGTVLEMRVRPFNGTRWEDYYPEGGIEID